MIPKALHSLRPTHMILSGVVPRHEGQKPVQHTGMERQKLSWDSPGKDS